jgi:iron complex outermembrane receptor protein/vitamin B12 transporter
MKSLFCAGLVLALAFTALAPRAAADSGAIRGTVRDPLGAIVHGAQVELLSKGKVVSATTTDGEGNYHFSPLPPGRYQVRTQAPSFKSDQTADIYVGGSGSSVADITLKIGTVSQQIVVSTTGTNLPDTQTGASVTVVPSEQFQFKLEALEPLRQVPGVQVLQTGQRGVTESLFIRGGPSTGNKILLDGIDMDEIGGTVDFGGVFTTGIDQMEVLRGPNSVLYGSDALAGVVNLTTTRGTTFRPQVSYAFDAGNFNSLHNDASVGGAFKQLDYFSEFSRFDGGNSLPSPAFHNATYAGNFGWTPLTSTALRVTVHRVVGKVDVPNAVDFLGIADDSFQSQSNTYIGATLDNQTTSYWHNQLRYTAMRQQSEFENPSPTGIFDPSSGNFLGNVVTIKGANGFSTTGQAILDFSGTYPQEFFIHNNRDAVNFQSDFMFNSHLGGLLGIHYEDERSDPAVERANFGYTGEIHGDLLNRLYGTAGLGIEKNAIFGVAVTPRISLAYYLLSPRATGRFTGTKLKFNYGQGIREPDVFSANNSLFGLLSQLPGGQQLISQFNVQPIGAVRSRSYDAGFEQLGWNGRVKFSVSGFYSLYTNQIESVSQGGLIQLGVPSAIAASLPFGASVNSLNTRSFGAENAVEVNVGHGFIFRATYTYLDAVVQRSFSSDELFPSFNPLFPSIPIGAFSPLVGNRPFNIAPHSGGIYLGYSHHNLALSLSGNLVSRRDSSTFLSDAQFGPTMLLPNRNLAAGYQKLDMGGSYQVSRHVQIYSTIENLISEHYDAVPGFPTLPFNFRIGVKLTVGGEGPTK